MTPQNIAPNVVRTTTSVLAAAVIIKLALEGVDNMMVLGLMAPLRPLSHGSDLSIRLVLLGLGLLARILHINRLDPPVLQCNHAS